MYRKAFFILIIFALGSIGCGRSGSSGDPGTGQKAALIQADEPVSPNDLAFLFPLAENGRPQPFITLGSQPGIPGSSNFQRIMDTAQANGVFVNDVISDPFNWALVSFRYSPCIFFVGQENPCKEHVRFIYQPMNQEDTGAFLDFSLHVTYEFGESEQATQTDLMAAVYSLRQAAEGKTDGVPLGVHPVLQERSSRAKYFNEIRNKVWQPFILDRDPKAITFMGLGVDPQDPNDVNRGEWRFMFGLIDRDGEWNLESLPDGSGREVESLIVDPNDGTLRSNISEQTEFNILTGRPVVETAAAGALHPLASNEHNVNCATCHVVDNQILRNTQARIDTTNFDRDQFTSELINIIGQDENGFNNNLTSNQFKGGLFSVADGVPQEDPNSPPPEEEVVTRMFGYMHSQPVISQRMAFDNGLSVNEMNKAIGMSETQQKANNLSCEGFSQAFDVLTCLFDGDFNTDLNQCLQQACQ